MPINRKESLVFTVLMCFFMVLVMSIYNVGLHVGFNKETFMIAWIGFPIAFIVGMISDWFIVSKPAKKIAFKIIKPDTKPQFIGLIVSSCMVIGMVIIMSLFGAIEQKGISSATLGAWAMNIPTNFIVALPLQLLIAGPIIRKLFRYLFPIGTITDISNVKA